MLVDYVKSLGIDTRSHDGQRLLEECVLCLVGVTGAFEFQHAVKNIDLTPTGMSGKDFRLALQANSYLTVNIKYAALFMGLSPTNANTFNKLQGYISATDVQLFRELFARRKIKSMVRDNALYRRLTVQDVTLAAMKKDKRDFENHIPKVMKHVKMKVYTKLRFVVNSENSTLKDFHSDVTCKVLRAYYQKIPTKVSDAEVLNYLRSAGSKHVINLIKFHTTDKRQRMVNTGKDSFGTNKFELVCESENQHRVMGEDGQEYSYEGITNNVSTDEVRKVESSIVYERLLSRYTGRKRSALEIMAGHHNENFNEFLREKGSLKDDDDHTDYQRRVGHKTFLHTLADYLGVIREAFMGFVDSVGQTLTAHKEYA